MDKLLIITNECFDTKSANGFCIEEVIKELSKLYYVDVVCFNSDEYKKNVNDSICVHYVENYVYNQQRSVFKKLKIRFVLSFLCADASFVGFKRMYKEVKRLIVENNYKLIVTSFGGMTPLFIADKLLKKHFKNVVPFYLDPPIPINFLYERKIYKKRMIYKEQKVFAASKTVILEDSLYDKMLSIYPNDNYIKTGMPLVNLRSEIIDFNKKARQGKIYIAFFGTLWESIRSPKYTIDLFSKFPNCEIHFYGSNQTKMVLSKYNSKNIKYCGECEKEKIFDIVKRYDALLNICNVNVVQTPSKIFDYINYLKPIINIVKKENDKTISIINKYMNSINLLENNDNNYDKLLAFLNEMDKFVFDLDKVKDSFARYTAKYSANLINSLVNCDE